MMVPFLVSGKCPDAIVSFRPNGLPPEELKAVVDAKGSGHCIPMIVEYPQLSIKEAEACGIRAKERAMLYVGCDVAATVGENGMIGARFVRGDMASASEKLQRGGHCLITDQLYLKRPERYDLGKTVTVHTEGWPKRKLEYEICGVVVSRWTPEFLG